jgi:hypothetical protein
MRCHAEVVLCVAFGLTDLNALATERRLIHGDSKPRLSAVRKRGVGNGRNRFRSDANAVESLGCRHVVCDQPEGWCEWAWSEASSWLRESSDSLDYGYTS